MLYGGHCRFAEQAQAAVAQGHGDLLLPQIQAAGALVVGKHEQAVIVGYPDQLQQGVGLPLLAVLEPLIAAQSAGTTYPALQRRGGVGGRRLVIGQQRRHLDADQWHAGRVAGQQAGDLLELLLRAEMQRRDFRQSLFHHLQQLGVVQHPFQRSQILRIAIGRELLNDLQGHRPAAAGYAFTQVAQ